MKELEYNDCVYIYEDKSIYFEFEDVMDAEACEREAISGLIKADLVVKE